MLVYHPAFDLYNCVFRVLQLIEYMKQDEVELDRLRIWDFYLTFPNEVRKISFPQALSPLKQVFKKKESNPYEDLIDSKRIADRMKPFQMSALKCLASYDLIDSKLLSKKIIKRTEKGVPKELTNQFGELTNEKENVLKLITGFSDLPLYGKMGLKSRTGLIEFRYDPK
ncbi:MAG: hypothetical protein RIE58_01260 [Vicingaceae bacterium]